MKDVDYSLIDEECVDMVKFFNEYGLQTKYSCQGHPEDVLGSYYIMFENTVTDNDMYDFVKLFKTKYSHSPFTGEFVKWMRKMSGEIICNWMYQITGTDDYKNWSRARQDLAIFKTILE